jgi:ATP-dependent Zn protease
VLRKYKKCEFLKNPEKYTNLGGKIPKRALLVALLEQEKLYWQKL